jgi:hypothetical protein
MQRLVRSPRRVLLTALLVGMSLAAVLDVWRRYAEATGTGEGSATTTYLLALALGFPTNVAVSALVEAGHAAVAALPFLAYLLFLLGIIVNALLIGVMIAKWRRQSDSQDA